MESAKFLRNRGPTLNGLNYPNFLGILPLKPPAVGKGFSQFPTQSGLTNWLLGWEWGLWVDSAKGGSGQTGLRFWGAKGKRWKFCKIKNPYNFALGLESSGVFFENRGPRRAVLGLALNFLNFLLWAPKRGFLGRQYRGGPRGFKNWV